MARRRVRDIYGNPVWRDDESPPEKETARVGSEKQMNEDLALDWRDYIAITIASLETILLPLVIFILVIFGIVIAVALFR